MLLTTQLIYGQDIIFHHLTTDEGLSQTSVVTIYQDEIGYIWIGSRDGLNRYDGNSIATYKLKKNDPNSLFCNNILKITGDKKGTIYLLTIEGLCQYDIKHDKFTTLWKDSDISTIYCHEDTLFIGKGANIYTLDPVKHTIIPYYQHPIEDIKISSLFIDSENTMYIGTIHNGLYTLKENKIPGHPISNANISSIFEDSNGSIWVGSWENGLYIISDKFQNQITNYRHNPQNPKSLSSNFVRSCAEDNQGNIWIGTFEGLNRFDHETGAFTHYNFGNTPTGLTHSSIWCVLKDHQGTIWLGTYFGGVNYFNPEYEIFTKYEVSDKEPHGLSSPIVGRMIEDKDKNLWICTEGGGLNKYNRKTETFKWYLPNRNKNSISENNVKAIYYDEAHDAMWLGLHLGGLNKLDLKTDKFIHYRHDPDNPNSIPSDIVRAIKPYKSELILATENGVCIFNPESGLSKPLLSDPKMQDMVKKVLDIYFDHQNNLWISVQGEGVFSYNFETDQLTKYSNDNNANSLSNNNVNSITQDKKHHLLFSTLGRGIDLYDYATNSFQNFDASKNGLSSDCVYNIYESNDNKLLVITNLGFSVFDLETKQFHNYGRKNGFPLSTVNENALYQTEDGEIFLGGVKGMVSFHEKALNFTPKPYDIIFSRLYVNNKPVNVGDETGILDEAFCKTPSITLKSNHSVFSIEFSTTNYIAANAGEILYRLEGFSNEWNTVHDQNIITYTNLNPGQYKLVLKVNNSKALVKDAVLNITILPPFYKTVWAYCIYAVILLTILYFIIRSYKAHVRLETSLVYEQKRLQDIEELNQSKLRFFTNISHEFRTPLTLIIGQLESTLSQQTYNASAYHKIRAAYTNSLEMRELISELLDFRKQEQGYMKIKVSENNIVDFLNNIFTNFQTYATNKNINFSFSSSESYIPVWYDKRQMQKVMNNLLANAFKYTEKEDSIWIGIKIDEEQSCVIVEIGDTGLGIDSKTIDRIFENFYQGGDTGSITSGTGIGLALAKAIVDLHGGEILVESRINEGSVFSVKLKLGSEHFDTTRVEFVNECKDVFQDSGSMQIQADEDNIREVSPLQTDENVKMLIVEDNASLLEMLVEIFAPFYQIVTASDGEEGLNKVEEENPDIIVSDVVMPKMTGIELCKAVKGDIDTSHIPVVLLTAKAAVEHNLEGLKYGADDYIAKPFNISLLIQRCNNLINSRISLKEKFSKQPDVTPQMLATNQMDKAFMDKLMGIIDQNMENSEFLIDDLASEIGMSRSKLFTKLRNVTGETPNNLLLKLRLKKAALFLINNPELNISDISVRVGFSSSRYFSKCFKDEYHTTPLAYRNRDNDPVQD